MESSLSPREAAAYSGALELKRTAMSSTERPLAELGQAPEFPYNDPVTLASGSAKMMDWLLEFAPYKAVKVVPEKSGFGE